MTEHSLTMQGRAALSVTGVEDVAAFDENQIALYTGEGMLIVSGAQLHISRLSVESGEMAIEGIIDSLEYTDQMKRAGGILARIFG